MSYIILYHSPDYNEQDVERPMRYGPSHKAKTKARILSQAGRLFRKRGYDGTAIDDIMAAATLTRGGFYAHFKSKERLFAEVLAAGGGLRALLQSRNARDKSALNDAALSYLLGYVYPANRKYLESICPMVTLPSDIARAGPTARRAYAKIIDAIAHELERGLPNARRRDPRALAAIVLAIGGLTLARAMGNEAASTALLHACGEELARVLGAPGAGERVKPFRANRLQRKEPRKAGSRP